MAIHDNKAHKYLVAHSQDKRHVDKNKLNKYTENEVTLLLHIIKVIF